MRRSPRGTIATVSVHVLAALAVAAPASARTWVVTVDGLGDTATIQAAIDSSSAGDVVRVGPGTYTGPGNQEISFLGKAITVESTDGPLATTLDADWHFSNRGVVFESGEGRSSILEGFTVTKSGPGLYCIGSSPTIRHCFLVRNFGNHFLTLGSGIVAKEGSDPLVEYCAFSLNWAADWSTGGGFYLEDSNATFMNCSFVRNSGEVFTSGPFVLNASSCTLVNCLVAQNQGAVLFSCVNGDEVLTLTCCNVWDNGTYSMGCVEGQLGINGNVSVDPLLCDPWGETLFLDEASPCLDVPGCGQIGALGIGCGAAVSAPEVDSMPWSRVKGLYRVAR